MGDQGNLNFNADQAGKRLTEIGKWQVDAQPLKSRPRSNKPYIASNGDLVIPFDSDPKYHWWNGGQGVEQTRTELNGGL